MYSARQNVGNPSSESRTWDSTSQDLKRDEQNNQEIEVKQSFGVTTEMLGKSSRRFSSIAGVTQFILDLLLALSALCFLVFAVLVYRNNGKHIDADPVPDLFMAAKYGPTVFPVLFAAIIGNFLRAAAAWKLERGISVMSLEYLLGSRTVFSTVTTPLILRTANVLTPLLIALWALSPLGGQAAIRIVGSTPTMEKIPFNISYLEVRQQFPHGGAGSSAGIDLLPATNGAFSAALSSPGDMKSASQDIFGNIKIPMVEPIQDSGAPADVDGWYDVQSVTNVAYSSLLGLPATGLKADANVSFRMETSYMRANCSVQPVLGMSYYDFALSMYNLTAGKGIVHTNGQSLLLYAANPTEVLQNKSLELVFTSAASNVTNATCTLTTSYVEADIHCSHSDCKTRRIRPVDMPQELTDRVVLNGLAPPGKFRFMDRSYDGFFPTLVNSTLSTYAPMWKSDPYSTPLELYFTQPESPYSARRLNGTGNFKGANIYPIGDAVFSQRFSQLLNTYWIASLSPFGVTGDFNDLVKDAGQPRGMTGDVMPIALNVNGTLTPDHLVLECHLGWLAVLIIASSVMFLAGAAAAVLGALRKGPLILDYSTSLLRDNRYASTMYKDSMEDGIEVARRSRDIKVCLGDAKPGEGKGYVALGTMEHVTPMSRVDLNRSFE
jgi:hypothetical protein